MSDGSIFVDETGEQGFQSEYYALTLVLHDQDSDVASFFSRYENRLRDVALPDIPLHTQPLLNGNDAYRSLAVSQRQRLLNEFLFMVQRLPIRYATLLYKKSDFESIEKLGIRIRRDIVNVLFDHLEFFQGFDVVKIYYDGGQPLVTKALRGAVEYALSKQAVLYRQGEPAAYRLAQTADFICTIELTARKYEKHEETMTDKRFFGTYRSFKKNYLKQVRRKKLVAQ